VRHLILLHSRVAFVCMYVCRYVYPSHFNCMGDVRFAHACQVTTLGGAVSIGIILAVSQPSASAKKGMTSAVIAVARIPSKSTLGTGVGYSVKWDSFYIGTESESVTTVAGSV
jgi:hypothetical protein